MRKTSLISLFLLICAPLVSAHTALNDLCRKAVSPDPAEATSAISELRSLGPAGLQSLREMYASEIARHVANPTLPNDADWIRMSTALDQVAQQKNSYLSGLYWYTDLKEAVLAAKRSDKPILSLRLLGKLSEDLSCANSRFFRTVLYSNPTIAGILKENFILHWQSVRAVPLITIDFGDGRKLERTITGNSIHYVLDSEGHLIDGIPGVYGPTAFLRELASATSIANSLRKKSEFERAALLKDYYRRQLNSTSLAWLADTTKIGGKLPEGYKVELNEKGEALSIMPLAVSKAVTETTILRAMTSGAEALGKVTDEAAWARIAALHRIEVKLDPQSVGLIKHQNPDLSDQLLGSLLEKFQQSVAMDTVRNDYLLHTKLYGQLLADHGRSSVDTFNEKVYAELFMTPRSDPWLGLMMPDTYTAIENGGIVKN